MNFTIRKQKIGKRTAAELCGIAIACYEGDLAKRYENPEKITSFAREWFRPELLVERAKKRIYWIARHGGKIAGFIGLDKKQNNELGGFEVHNLYVKKEFREKGIGTKLMETALNYAKFKKVGKLVLQAAAGSEECHKRFGFKITGKKNLFMGISVTKMEKNV